MVRLFPHRALLVISSLSLIFAIPSGDPEVNAWKDKLIYHQASSDQACLFIFLDYFTNHETGEIWPTKDLHSGDYQEAPPTYGPRTMQFNCRDFDPETALRIVGDVRVVGLFQLQCPPGFLPKSYKQNVLYQPTGEVETLEKGHCLPSDDPRYPTANIAPGTTGCVNAQVKANAKAEWYDLTAWLMPENDPLKLPPSLGSITLTDISARKTIGTEDFADLIRAPQPVPNHFYRACARVAAGSAAASLRIISMGY